MFVAAVAPILHRSGRQASRLPAIGYLRVAAMAVSSLLAGETAAVVPSGSVGLVYVCGSVPADPWSTRGPCTEGDRP